LRFDSTQTVPGASFAPALAQQGGVAVSRLDGRGISLLRRMTLITTSQAHRCTCVTMKKITRPYPDPFLGSAWLWRPLLAGPGLAWVRCLASDDDSLVARAGITGGDLNPTCLPSLSAH